VRPFEIFLHRVAREEWGETLTRLVETGAMDEQTEQELTELCKTAAERYLKENPEAGLA
jgi:hypothetical protein